VVNFRLSLSSPGNDGSKMADQMGGFAEGEGGMAAVGDLSDFTSTDRTQVIEKLLAQDEVLAFLYDHLFPPQQASPSQSASESRFPPMPFEAQPMAAGSALNAVSSKRNIPLSSDTEAYLKR
jgi:hypothetical protein